MSEHRRDLGPAPGSASVRSVRRIVTAVTVIGLSGLVFGALLAPVSADDVVGRLGSGVSVAFDGDCATVAVGGDGADAGLNTEGDDGPSGPDATGAGRATSDISVCLDDASQGLPEDPGGGIPEDPAGSVPDDFDSVVGEVSGAVLGQLDGADPGGVLGGAAEDLGDLIPGPPDDALPGGPGDVVPGDIGGDLPGAIKRYLPDGLGLVPDLVDGIPALIPEVAANGEPDGNDGPGPATGPSASGSGATSVVADSGNGDPADSILGGELASGGQPSTGETELSTGGGTLPRTGGGLGSGVLRLIAALGTGHAALRLTARRSAKRKTA